jgi:hypothetical protein
MKTYTQLGLRGFPRDLARSAKKAAAQQEMTLSQYVAQAVEMALSREPAHERDLPSIPAELERDVRWYESHRAALLASKKYQEGTNLGIVDEAVVDVDSDLVALMTRLRRRYGRRTLFVPRLERERQRVVKFRSPRRAS